MKFREKVRKFVSRLLSTSSTTNTPGPEAHVTAEDIMNSPERLEVARKLHYKIMEESRDIDPDSCFGAMLYLIDFAENVDHLRSIISRIKFHASYTRMTDLHDLWDKWQEYATTAKDMAELWTYRKWLTTDQMHAAIKKWYHLAKTYQEIILVPEVENDDLLLTAIVTKKAQLADASLREAKTCTELIQAFDRITHSQQPKSLAQYPSWSKDEDLPLSVIGGRCCENGTVLDRQFDEKWLRVSLRAIQAVNDTAEISQMISRIHPETHEALKAKWDVLSSAEVDQAVGYSEILAAYGRCRVGSKALENATIRLNNINMDRVERATTSEALWDCFHRSGLKENVPSNQLAITKLSDLAMTEADIRAIWSYTESLPTVRLTLLDKFDKLTS
jgi:hypothetical protein